MKSPITFEIRIPAYDRHEMLCRALNSLQAQTYPHWKAIVFDDSSSYASKDVIQSIADDRISYLRNPKRLGAAGNIDQCFSPTKVLGGDYACLLEDDNFWLPDFLSVISDHIGNGRWEIILSNQRINEEGVGLRPLCETTRGDWFSTTSVGPLDLRATLLLMEGLSNGGLVWRLGSETDLRVGPQMPEAGLQEACRSLLVRTPFLFIEEAQAVWTSTSKTKSARATESNRMIGRGMQSIRDFVLRIHGRSVVHIAKSLAARKGLTSRVVEALAYSGHPHLAGDLLRGRGRLVCRAFAKGLAIRAFQRDPCAAFLRSSLPAKISCPELILPNLQMDVLKP
jgi:glycosyltransferase involved in cell wall biosynthesis